MRKTIFALCISLILLSSCSGIEQGEIISADNEDPALEEQETSAVDSLEETLDTEGEDPEPEPSEESPAPEKMAVSFKDFEITIPGEVSDLAKLGLSIEKGDYTLSPGYTSSINVSSEDASAVITIFNDSDEDKLFSDCQYSAIFLSSASEGFSIEGISPGDSFSDPDAETIDSALEAGHISSVYGPVTNYFWDLNSFVMEFETVDNIVTQASVRKK